MCRRVRGLPELPETTESERVPRLHSGDDRWNVNKQMVQQVRCEWDARWGNLSKVVVKCQTSHGMARVCRNAITPSEVGRYRLICGLVCFLNASKRTNSTLS